MTKLSDNPEVKERIKKELFQCMLEMPYHKITVKKLVERLGMSRQNFYRYYISKDEILLDLLDSTLDVAYLIIETNLDPENQEFKSITDSVERLIIPKKDLINEILSCSNEKIVFAHLQSFIRRIVGRLLREKNYKNVDQDYLDIVISQYAGSGYHLVKSWAHIDSDVESAKLKQLIFKFVVGLFSAVDDALVV